MDNLNKEIAESKMTEQKLDEIIREWQDIFDAIPDFAFVLDKDYRFVKVNKVFCNFIKAKPEDLIGKKCYEVVHKSDKPWPTCPAVEVFKDKKIHTEEVNDPNIELLLLVSASPLFDKNGEIKGIIHLAKDITERKKSEEELKRTYRDLKETQEQLIHSEKMASLGQLAAGAAHEINNPLTAILGEAELLSEDEDKDRDTKDAAKIIVEQSKRIKSITERLLKFSRKREIKLEPLDIKEPLEAASSILTYYSKAESLEMAKKVEVIKELDSDLPKIVGDREQLQELFFNIMLNAIQAIEKVGRLTIRAHSEEVTEDEAGESDAFKQGQRIVVIEFEDTGGGMEEGTLKKIFDPFFTTKEKSTGLGLPICYGIVKSHNGAIEARSELGKGSTFFVKFPVYGGKR